MASIVLAVLITAALLVPMPSGHVRLAAVVALFATLVCRETVCELGLAFWQGMFAALIFIILSAVLAAIGGFRQQSNEPAESDERLSVLSGRERQIIEALMVGKTNSEISAELGVASSTVGTYRRRAMEKLSVESVSDLCPVDTSGQVTSETRSVRPVVCWMILAAVSVLTAICPSELAGLLCFLLAFSMGLAVVALCAFGHANAKSGISTCVSLAEFLCLSVTLRGVAFGLLPPWAALLPVGSCAVETCLCVRFGLVESVSAGDARPIFASAGVASAGICLGPSSADVLFVQLGDVLAVDWKHALGVFAIAATICAAILTYLIFIDVPVVKTSFDLRRARLLLLGRGLSDLEADVLVGIARGLSSAELAVQLSIARGTVNSCRLRGYRQLGIHSRQELKDYLNGSGAVKERIARI